MLPSYSIGYFYLFPILIFLVLIFFFLYQLLRKKILWYRPLSSALLAGILMYGIVYFVNSFIGLFFSHFALYPTGALLIVILLYDLFIRKIKSRILKTLAFSILYVVVSAGLFSIYINAYDSYFQPYYPSYTDYDDCVKNIGEPCIMIEDKGKVTASKTPEIRDLMKKYGREKLTFQALDIALAHDMEYVKTLYPSYQGHIGCIIVVTAGNEGYVMFERENLEVEYIQTLEEFKQATATAPSEILDQFYASLH